MNTAQQIHHALGMNVGSSVSGTRNPHTRKSGPRRRHADGYGSKTTKQKAAGAFSRGLHNNITRKQLAALA